MPEKTTAPVVSAPSHEPLRRRQFEIARADLLRTWREWAATLPPTTILAAEAESTASAMRQIAALVSSDA